jgi:probable HAF family extracellular repeat protein
VVVGSAADGAAQNQTRAFRWTQSSGMVSLGVMNGGTSSNANGVSADGLVVVGASADGAAGDELRAFRWTGTSGMVSLGTLRGGTSSVALGVSGNGLVVVGFAADGGAANAERAFRWTETGGLQSVADWLRKAGVPVADEAALGQATATNSDGSVVVGVNAAHDEVFIARVGAPSTGLTTLAPAR